MSLNKFTTVEKGKEINLKIGCDVLECGTCIVDNILIPEGGEIKAQSVYVEGNLKVKTSEGDINYTTPNKGQNNFSLHTDGNGGTFWAPDDTGSGDLTYNGVIPVSLGQHVKLSSTDAKLVDESKIIEDATNLNISGLNITNSGLINGQNPIQIGTNTNDIVALKTKTQNISASTTFNNTIIGGKVLVNGNVDTVKLNNTNNVQPLEIVSENTTLELEGENGVNIRANGTSLITVNKPVQTNQTVFNNDELVTKQYVDSNISPPVDISELENKTQNISTLTQAGRTQYSGNQDFYMGNVVGGDVFSLISGSPGDLFGVRIMDISSQGINALTEMNTARILPDNNNMRDIGSSTLQYKDIYSQRYLQVKTNDIFSINSIQNGTRIDSAGNFAPSFLELSTGGLATVPNFSLSTFGNVSGKDITPSTSNLTLGNLNSRWTEAYTDYTFKRESPPPTTLGNFGITYVNTSGNLVYAHNNIQYPVAGKDVKTVTKFNASVDTVLYEDDFMKFDWFVSDLQPSFIIKTSPQGPGAFGDWVDCSIVFVGGNASSGGNGDGTDNLGLKCFFYGSQVRDTNFNHLNWGSTSKCTLCAETDLNYPSYRLELITGDVSSLGVAVIEKF